MKERPYLDFFIGILILLLLKELMVHYNHNAESYVLPKKELPERGQRAKKGKKKPKKK